MYTAQRVSWDICHCTGCPGIYVHRLQGVLGYRLEWIDVVEGNRSMRVEGNRSMRLKGIDRCG